MPQFREPTAADRRAGIRVLVGYVVAISVTSVLMFLVPGPLGLAVWLVLVLIGTALLARWNSRHSGYRCRHCGHEFEISTLTELASPHGTGDGGWKYLRCPACDRKSRAKVLVRIRGEE
jgi:DNA-directed RNA polymerase subunit RPC12/RpoP